MIVSSSAKTSELKIVDVEFIDECIITLFFLILFIFIISDSTMYRSILSNLSANGDAFSYEKDTG